MKFYVKELQGCVLGLDGRNGSWKLRRNGILYEKKYWVHQELLRFVKVGELMGKRRMVLFDEQIEEMIRIGKESREF